MMMLSYCRYLMAQPCAVVVWMGPPLGGERLFWRGGGGAGGMGVWGGGSGESWWLVEDFKEL